MSYLTTVCALVLVVQLAVALVWHTWWRQSLLALEHCFERVNVKLDRTATSQLRIELDGLAESVARLSRSNRAEFSRIYAKIQQLNLPLRAPTADQSDDMGAALVEAGGDAAKVGEAYIEMGVNRAPRTGLVCTCGWCASCVERSRANA